MTGSERSVQRCVLVATAFGMVGLSQPVGAQTMDHWSVGGGIRLLGAVPLGDLDAVHTGNVGPPLILFTTHSELAGSAGWQVILGRRVAESLHVEATISIHPVTFTTRVTDDAEGADSTSATERLTHVQAEGGVRWSPARWRLTPRTEVFATAGGGYLRQLHAGRTLVETGRSFYLGGGVLRSMWRGARGRSVEARLDGRAVLLLRGVALDDRLRATPALSVAAQYRF